MSTFNAEAVAVDGQQQHGDSVVPAVLVCRDPGATLADAAQWVASERAHLLELANRTGAVLLHDFPVQSAEDFDVLVQALSLTNFPHKKSLSNAVRINRTEGVFSANEAPACERPDKWSDLAARKTASP